MFGMLIVTLLTIITGGLAFGIQEGKGILSFGISSILKRWNYLKEFMKYFQLCFSFDCCSYFIGVLSDRLLP